MVKETITQTKKFNKMNGISICSADIPMLSLSCNNSSKSHNLIINKFSNKLQMSFKLSKFDF